MGSDSEVGGAATPHIGTLHWWLANTVDYSRNRSWEIEKVLRKWRRSPRRSLQTGFSSSGRREMRVPRAVKRTATRRESVGHSGERID